jgi:hypothetical protein
MRTKHVDLSADPLQRFRDALRRPHGFIVEGIDAFWLENVAGDRISSSEYPDTGPALAETLAALENGADPEDIVLVGQRSRGGGRSVISRGLILLDLAEAAAGIPARPRVARE